MTQRSCSAIHSPAPWRAESSFGRCGQGKTLTGSQRPRSAVGGVSGLRGSHLDRWFLKMPPNPSQCLLLLNISFSPSICFQRSSPVSNTTPINNGAATSRTILHVFGGPRTLSKDNTRYEDEARQPVCQRLREQSFPLVRKVMRTTLAGSQRSKAAIGGALRPWGSRFHRRFLEMLPSPS